MIDFLKHGFSVKEIDRVKCIDEAGITYENELLEIQHWKKPDIYIIAVRRERFIVWKEDFYTVEQALRLGRPNTGDYEIRSEISEAEKKFARHIMASNSYNMPLYVGAIKGETFFEILISSVCTDVEKIMQCGS